MDGPAERNAEDRALDVLRIAFAAFKAGDAVVYGGMDEDSCAQQFGLWVASLGALTS